MKMKKLDQAMNAVAIVVVLLVVAIVVVNWLLS